MTKQKTLKAKALLMLLAHLVASSALNAASEAPLQADNKLSIRKLQRSRMAVDSTPSRDPFAARSSEMPTQPPPLSTPSANLRNEPPFPELRILGKQEDETGWSVFISQPDKPDQLWVVREGELFDAHLRVIKIAPPRLIVKNTMTRQSRIFNLGKEDEE